MSWSDGAGFIKAHCKLQVTRPVQVAGLNPGAVRTNLIALKDSRLHHSVDAACG